ncbi:hypothetical protein Csp1_25580 [Corynebacterium provencense]|uniref:Uncharacterized protein n=1 Tax=Corynebacterium provencense TaxID=1737425 RepID=A0A2Z3YR23_9CORY|nr:hypothetical protein Csp1_25580 [Corynebacterium provencense]
MLETLLLTVGYSWPVLLLLIMVLIFDRGGVES